LDAAAPGEIASRYDMPSLSTIDDLTNAIWTKLQKVIVVPAPISAFDVDAIEVFGPPEWRRPATRTRRPKTPSIGKGRRVKAKRPKKTTAKRTKKSRR
jgi:hypothetical protein